MTTRTVELRDAESLNIATRSGALLIIAETGRVDVEVDGLVEQRRKPQIWRERKRLYIRSRRGSNALTVKCPPGTDIRAKSASGKIELRGEFGDVDLKSESSSIDVESVISADVKSRVGSIKVGAARGQLSGGTLSGSIDFQRARTARAMSVSGRIRLRDIVGSAHAASVSGAVEIETEGAGDIHAATVSGSIRIRIPEDRAPSIEDHRKAGSLTVDCEQGTDLAIKVATVSGSIKIDHSAGRRPRTSPDGRRDGGDHSHKHFTAHQHLHRLREQLQRHS